MPVNDLKLPGRAAASLHREGITTVGQLATRTEDELLALDGIGPASVVDIKSKLTDLGLTLGQPHGAASAPAAARRGRACRRGRRPPSAAAPSAGSAGSATPHASATREAAHQLEDDAINLLKVAGMPVLKRAIPVLAALTAALLLLGLRRKMRRRRAS